MADLTLTLSTTGGYFSTYGGTETFTAAISNTTTVELTSFDYSINNGAAVQFITGLSADLEINPFLSLSAAFLDYKGRTYSLSVTGYEYESSGTYVDVATAYFDWTAAQRAQYNALTVTLTPSSGNFAGQTSVSVSAGFTSVSAITSVDYQINDHATITIPVTVGAHELVNNFVVFDLETLDYPGTCTFSMTGYDNIQTFIGSTTANYDWTYNELSVSLTPLSSVFLSYSNSMPVSTSFTTTSAISSIDYILNSDTVVRVLSSVDAHVEVNPFTQFALQFFDYPGTCSFAMTAYQASGNQTFSGSASAYLNWSFTDKEHEGTRKYILGYGRGNKGKTT